MSIVNSGTLFGIDISTEVQKFYRQELVVIIILCRGIYQVQVYTKLQWEAVDIRQNIILSVTILFIVGIRQSKTLPQIQSVKQKADVW